MPKIFTIFGAAGTGKTTTIAKQIETAARKYERSRILVASFTKAAALEIGGRENAQGTNIGTLHAHGYRCLGERVPVAENHLGEWNKEQPNYQISGGKPADVDDVQEVGSQLTPADEYYSEMNLNRARLIPKDRWRIATRAFAAKWDAFKAGNGLIDYTDMIEIPLQERIPAPGQAQVGFFDEAQDFSLLEAALIYHWAEGMDYLVLAGDDDQTIYGWAGATHKVLTECEATEKIILKQSYRVPRAVHELAQRTIQTIKDRQPKDVAPRPEDGEARTLRNANFNTPEALIRDMQKYTEAGKTVMVLASCAYMLNPLVDTLRKEGIPFHNPYRLKNGAWNPLHRQARGTSSIEQLLAFTEQVPNIDADSPWGMIDIRKFLLWFDAIKATGNLSRGAKEAITQRLLQIQEEFKEPTFGASMMRGFFVPESAIFEILGKDNMEAATRWFLENVPAPKAKTLEYSRQILLRRGAQALKNKPQILIGTIHSVKGGEADVVYVAPDISRNAYDEMCGSNAARDAVTRLKYVAYTRARESLILLDPATRYAM